MMLSVSLACERLPTHLKAKLRADIPQSKAVRHVTKVQLLDVEDVLDGAGMSCIGSGEGSEGVLCQSCHLIGL